MQKDVGYLSIVMLHDISLALQDVDMASCIVFTRLEDCEHLLDEDAIYEAVHVKDLLKYREFINFAPRFRCPISDDRIFRPALLLSLNSILLLPCGDRSLFDLTKLGLMLPPVKGLKLGLAELVVVISTLFKVKSEDEFLHNIC